MRNDLDSFKENFFTQIVRVLRTMQIRISLFVLNLKTSATRKSSCANARGIPPAVLQVLGGTYLDGGGTYLGVPLPPSSPGLGEGVPTLAYPLPHPDLARGGGGTYLGVRPPP